MKPDIVKFVESTLGLELKEYQKRLFRTYYEHNIEKVIMMSYKDGRKIAEDYCMAIDHSERILGHCRDCKYFEYDSVAKVDGIPLIVAHEICSKWGNGCKTREDGYCFLFKPKEEEK